MKTAGKMQLRALRGSVFIFMKVFLPEGWEEALSMSRWKM